ncbi:hypothetical protein ANCCEY_02608 [Ancylostoma ceylanicum]|uniref:Uncharacterized protein n=1 Tax=Ancylostoma ceylanicum TaxID=53326 RepID=A0A0D6M7B6_9BILA|nr:hypothetical protein ANCCEY_02608 [Ancylostoma ceylanicum]
MRIEPSCFYHSQNDILGILTQVQDYYNIDDSMAGLIQTVFLAFFMIGSPLCGYLGDSTEFSGLGFVVGSNVASLMNAWQWGIRVTAVAGIVALALLIFLVYEPERGAAEKQEGGAAQKVDAKTSYWEDIKSLATTIFITEEENPIFSSPTFVSCTWAYTALLFVTGTLTWWEPTIIEHSLAWNQGLNDTRLLPNQQKNQ